MLLALLCIALPGPSGLWGQSIAVPLAAVPDHRIEDLLGAVSGGSADLLEARTQDPQDELSQWLKAAEFALSNEEDFATALDVITADPRRLRGSVLDEGTRAVKLALVATSDHHWEEFIADAPAATKGQLEVAGRVLRQTLRSITTPPTLSIFANGDIRGGLSDGGDFDTGTGSLGLEVLSGRHRVLAGIAIATTGDAVADDFGRNVLTPVNGDALTSGVLDYRRLSDSFFGNLHFYGSISRQDWRTTAETRQTTDDQTVVVDTVTQSTVVIGVGALLSHRVVSGTVASTPVSLSLEGGLAGRVLAGDAAQGEGFSVATLGSDETKWWGFDAGLELGVGQVAGQLHFYHIFGDDVPGLTGGQVVAAFSVAGDIFGGTVESR